MQVNVRRLLPGGFAVGEEQVYALTAQRARTESDGNSLRDDHEMARSELLEL